MKPTVLVLVTVLCLGYSYTSLAKDYEPIPDTLLLSVRIGCLINGITEPLGNINWYTHVWVEYANGERWTRLYSIRPENKRMESFKDCDRWSKFAAKARKEEYELKTKAGVSY